MSTSPRSDGSRCGKARKTSPSSSRSRVDLAIRGATVITDGAYARDILIRDGRVSALVAPGASTADAAIDARALFALPGLVDPHVHFNEPGRGLWDGCRHGTRRPPPPGVPPPTHLTPTSL